MTITLQPFDNTLGSFLINAMNNGYTKLTMVSAFVKSRGICSLCPSLDDFRKNGGKVTIIVGVDMNGTSYEGLLEAIKHSDETYVVGFSNPGVIFHPKIYLLEGQNCFWGAVGSNNLTRGGLWLNVECFDQFDNTSPDGEKKLQELKEITSRLKQKEYGALQLTPELANKLLDNQIVRSETKGEYKNPESGQNNLFSPLNNHKKSQDSLFAILPTIEETMWFETGSMTGGARNILDLSKSGTIMSGSSSGTFLELPNDDKHVRGGVVFFGVDPNTTNSKDITIEYDGRKYENNTIKIETTGNKPNLSWRLQIKGISENGTKLTSILGNKLSDSILLFEKTDETDTYLMRILPNTDIEDIIRASRVVARNGRSLNGRRYGLLRIL